jgi:hypothetical protein
VKEGETGYSNWTLKARGAARRLFFLEIGFGNAQFVEEVFAREKVVKRVF